MQLAVHPGFVYLSTVVSSTSGALRFSQPNTVANIRTRYTTTLWDQAGVQRQQGNYTFPPCRCRVSTSSFLLPPTPPLLATDATLHYITTTTTFRSAAEIIKHLSSQRNQIKKKKEDVLTAVEGDNVVALEFDTALEFVISGGTYLPGLDDNFLADRTVILPIMHIVTFDNEGKILQIRQTWDQGAMLKQVDVIGKTGRNWPIRDSQEQIKMITNAAKSVSAAASTQRKTDPAVRSRGDSNNSPLFGTREENNQSIASVISPRGGVKPKQRGFDEILGEEPAGTAAASVVSPRGGARPTQRSFYDIVGEEEDNEEEGSPGSGRGRSRSPSKTIAPKAGGDKKFQPSRLFEREEESEAAKNAEAHARERSESPFKSIAPKAGGDKKFKPSRLFETNEDSENDAPGKNGKGPELFYRPNPKRFDHFEFGDGSDPTDAPAEKSEPQPRNSKHGSQWSFDDFVTPQKVAPTRTLQRNNQDSRHWGTGDDVAEEAAHPAQQRIRPSAEVHFEMQDDGTPVASRQNVPRGVSQNANSKLYKDRTTGEEEADNSSAEALGNITNLKNRNTVFGSQFDMTDSSPAQKENQPTKPANKGASSGDRGIRIGGDGMGGAKGTNRDWMFGDGGEEEDPKPAKPMPGRKQGANSGGFNWDF
ncbi:hypothetical protein PG994_010840 [Apiospora phragmitis]|uniref:Uncharacterized protein n=1 Tax=Apiospora phragmitis TaxID=2905665 RepID=A0ABR1TR48_9PEZI